VILWLGPMTVGARAGRKWCDAGVLTPDDDRLCQPYAAKRAYADWNELAGRLGLRLQQGRIGHASEPLSAASISPASLW
jgi:hypothetical protein